ncbi:hypothetical protein K1719_031396 [Acacia pycnantha]|nr:hypothetical protein K1719_031396 [Acacia pycnantha]
MAKLPPKIPNTKLGWSELPYSSPPEIPSGASFSPDNAATTAQDPFWADEFHDFWLVRHQGQCPSVSDYITFLEDPEMHVARNVRPRFEAENEFDKFDDEKFMTMFDNDEFGAANSRTMSSPKSSSPSDHKSSIKDEKEITNQVQQQQNLHNQNEDQQHQHLKNEPDEVETQINKQQKIHPSNDTLASSSSDKISDPKRVKRILANRKSAQRSRVRKLQYINELERSVTSLQSEVSVMSPRVAFLDRQRLLLSVDNDDLKQRIAALAQDKIFKDALQDALRREIERLRQVCHQQKLNNIENVAGSTSPSPNPKCHGQAETEQLRLNV